jgi:hypothetical protein
MQISYLTLLQGWEAVKIGEAIFVRTEILMPKTRESAETDSCKSHKTVITLQQYIQHNLTMTDIKQIKLLYELGKVTNVHTF